MMNSFYYRHGEMFAESVPLAEIASIYGTPAYVYSRATLEKNLGAYLEALAGMPHLLCYAVKANSNIAILNILGRMGAGFDIVSVGELERVIKAGGSPAKIVFSGVGKKAGEMARALDAGIHCFNVESQAELHLLSNVANQKGVTANISIRVNPDVDANTHPYISTGLRENKFGIDIHSALDVFLEAQKLPGIRILGVDCHIGSQLTEISPFLDALDRVLLLVDELTELGITLQHLDLGGGLGVRYRDENPPHPSSYISEVRERLQGRELTLILEPGRSIVADAGVLLTEVLYLKETAHKNFAVIDAAMNDLIRPSLYQAWMPIDPVVQKDGESRCYDIVGPVCETGDFLGKDRELALQQGDLLSVGMAGAYGFTMSSNYNSRGRAAEILVDGSNHYLVRRRETIEEQMANETLAPLTDRP